MVEIGKYPLEHQRRFYTATPLSSPVEEGDIFVRYESASFVHDAAMVLQPLTEALLSKDLGLDLAYRVNRDGEEGSPWHPFSDGILVRIEQVPVTEPECEVLALMMSEVWNQPVEVWNIDSPAPIGATRISATLHGLSGRSFVELLDEVSGTAFDLFGLKLAVGG